MNITLLSDFRRDWYSKIIYENLILTQKCCCSGIQYALENAETSRILRQADFYNSYKVALDRIFILPADVLGIIFSFMEPLEYFYDYPSCPHCNNNIEIQRLQVNGIEYSNYM